MISYLVQASKLLGMANRYLKMPSEAEVEKSMSEQLGLRHIPFSEVLKPVGSPPPGRKKAKTMVGSITTRKGLVKAIRRLFGNRAENIIKAGKIYGLDIQQIIKDQDSRRTKPVK